MAQVNDNDDIKWLYGKLKAKGYNIGSESEFKSSLANGEDRKWYYEKAKGMGLDMGSMDDFESMYAPKAAPAPKKGTPSSGQQKPAVTPAASSAPAKQQPKKDQPLTPAQRQAMIDQVQQMQQQTQAMIADTNERMNNMKEYGVGLGFGQTKKSGYKVNPRTGKLEQTYITPTGNRYNNKALADAESFHYRQEASKPLGLTMNDQQVDAAQKPANAAVAALWKEAEAKYAADRNKNAEEVYGGNPWLHAGREMHIVDAATNSHKNEVSHLTRFDLQKMMDNAWGRVGKQMTASCYAQLKKQYPTATEQQLQNSASAMARQLSDNAVYKYAVAKNTPKSTLEFFAKTAADMNLLRTISKGLARSEAGTTGDLAAYEAAMGEYGKNHRWAQIGGTVTGMLFDPTTYISGGVGSFTGKTALNIGGRIVAKKTATNVGARLSGNTLTGRVVAGMAGGAGNLGTYEGIKEGESQWLHGGHINPQTGENEGYSAGDVLKSSLHGTLLGSVTGTVSPLLGNVADKWVKATSNTAGKVGIRAGELATSTVAEGTIFSMPEWISGDGDAMDVWTDNMAMMIGFKGQHMIKSAPRVIAGLRPIENPQTMRERNHNRMSFVERLRKQVDASPRDMAFTKEEREELQKYGYGDLATLFTRTPKQQPKPKSKPTTKDGKVMYLDIPEAEVEDLGKQWLKQHPEFDGYEAMERLMQDPNVSQSARAKAYYILTGRQLPMGSVTGYTTEQDENGNIFVKSVTANGEVVTSRRFADETLAKKEQDKIMRQAELNSVDVGERYTEAKADNKVFEAAVEAVAPGADPETVKRNYQAAKQGDKDAIANYGQMVDAIDKFMEENKGMADTERPEAIRAAIKEETGVDVDEAIKKEPSKRTEPEKAAVQDYIERLFPEQKAENEQPMSEEESAAAAAYDQARLLWDKVEKGDADAKAEVDAITLRMQEAYQMCEDAFGADAEMRIAEINEDPWPLVNNPELSEDQQDAVLYYVNAKAAMEGVMDAFNEAADGKRKEVEANVERHTHKDMGVVQPATMKVDDKPVYVVKGNVVMLPDGSGIDVRNSDQSIVICDAETGEYKFASPDQLFSLGEAIDPQTELDEAYANIQAEHEAVLGVPENGENVQGNGENVPNSAENVPQLTDEQLQQYAHSAFNEATQSNGITIPQEQAEQLQQHNQQMLEQEQQRKEEEANRQPTALERVPINEETGEPMFEKADRETALDALNEVTGGNDENTTAIVRAQVEQATKALEALKKKEPTKKAPSLKGSPMAMVKAQQEAEANYNTAMEEYNAQVAAAEENLNAWSRINSLMNDRKRAIREQQETERKVREEKLHAEAVARLEEDKRIAAKKAAEQAEVGTHAVNPKIKAKWDGATKVEGNPNAITLADGSTIRGHYVLTEAGAATASHDVNNAYEPTEGFPVDENGESVNDRDYKRDRDAQRIVRDMAGNYKKGHVQVGTFDITIEQPQGSVRKGTDANGKQWESKMNNTYGYIRGAVGVDGDHIDVFLSNDIDGWNGRKVFVVDQYNPDGSFDEHKVMLGFNDQDEAKGDYLANYEQGWENGRRIDITGVNLEDFEKWIESSKRKTKPFGEYSSVKKDVVEINAPEEAGYSITPSTYTNKKGKTSDVSLLTFDHDLTVDQERAVKEFAKERTGEGRFAPARGWKDRESGGWMFRSEEDARKAAEMVGNEEAVADNQPMTAQELRDAVEPKKPTTSKKTASKKPANRVESVPTEEPIEPEKPNDEGGIRIDTGLAPVMWVNAHPDRLRHKSSESAEPKHEAVGDFYEDGINENAVAALPEDTAIQLHVVDILNPGMTDHSMKSKIESLNTLLPKISDKKLSELDKEYGDDKDMGTHIKAEVARRENEGIFKKAERIAKEAKTEREKTPIDNNGFGIYQKAYDDFIDGIEHKGMLPNVKALKNMVTKAKRRLGVLEKGAAVGIKNDEGLKRHEKAVHELINMRDAYQAMLDYVNKRMKASEVKTSKVKPEQPVGDLFAGLFDEQKENGFQRNDDAVRTETVPTDNSGQQQGLRGGERAPRKAAAQKSGRPDGGRGGQSTGKDRAVSAGLHGLTEPKNTRNNHSERGADHAPTSVNGRIEANIKAIELAHELLESGETATPEQMSVLRQFSGWGGLGAAFSDGGYDWKQRERNKKIRELLGEEAYEQAVMSANSAYYTPAYVVDTLWDIANQLGFKGGNILEGSAGIGNILGQMPTMVSERSNIHAIEIDGTSGGILSLLYPDAKVEIQGFEQTRIPNGSVDLAITNVPFVTGLRVNDTTGDSDLSKKFHNIHDFCIAKNVRKLREGGLGIFISSNGTLDNSKALRDWCVNEGGSDFIGAFRMNNKTFGGTTVTSDIIVIRKRVNGQKSAQAIDVSSISGERTAEYEEPGARKAKQLSMDYNKYFIEHPDHMAGEMRFAFEEGDTFRPTSKGLYPVSGKDQGKMLVDFVKSFTEEDSNKAITTDHHDVSLVLDASADGKKLGEMYMKDGQIVLTSFGGYYPLEVNDKKIKGHTKQECFTAYAAIKSALADVMQYQTENESDAGLKPLIAKLNKAYDAFVNTYGHFNKNKQLAWLRNDVDYPNVFSLETYKEQGDGKGGVVKTYDKADVMKGRVVEKESEPHPENVKDGVVVSMFKNGRIDVPYIASQLGKSETEVKREIIDSGLGFEDPTTRQMEVSYQYLSGNVREKLKQAEANNDNGEYSKNIKALQDVVPMNIPAHLIDFTLGSSWLDPKLYDEYVKERTDIDVHFTAAGGTWFMKAPTYGVNVEKNRAMGIVSEMLKKTIMGHELISAAIQNKSIIVSRTEKHYDGTTEIITDREATAACAAKIDEIRQDFKDWARGKMQSDADLSARMEQEYNDRFNNYVPMSIPDDFVPEYFGGATHKFKMRSHQGKAIVRGTMQPLLLAHEVGTGKTFTLISTAMEMRRLGTARKPMIVVQNATVGQFAASAKELYPNAKILTLEDNDRNAEGRKNFYAKIKYNDWDMIVVPQSTFEFIPDSDERQMQFVQDKIDEKMLVLEQMREADSSGRDPITRRAEKELADLQAEMAALSEGISKKRTANNEKKKAVAKQNAAVKAQEMLDRRTDDVENFDDMGIDALLIDEAHEYKHLGFATAMQRGVKGVDPSYSKKSQGVYLKTQAILEKNNGRNVIFATGTPISNTAAEIWTFMRYLMPKDTMKEYGIYYFDDFVRNFGNIQQMPEFNTSGKFKEVNRFAGYVNLPELVRIWSGVADIVLTKDQTELVKKIPEMEGGKAQDIYLPQTRALRSVMKYVREELERFDQMSGKEKKENSSIPLTMYGIAKGAAVDARLVEMHAEDDPRSKTNEAVRQTLRSLKETDDYKGTVAIFADHYQNKRSGFNLYEDIKKKLIQQGVPESEVIVMKPGMTIKKKLEIFDKVNRGEVRVILGSTATLGTGVNIQERLHTLIHLDAPNRPMDYTQRNGRILRQGNLHKQWNKPVRVLRFGVEDSLDVTAYQRLKTKGAIADSVMEGDRLMQDSMNNRVLEEEEDVFGDTVAQLSGSEYALLKNNAEKNVRKYESRKKQWEADQTYIHNAKPKLEGQIKAAEQRAEEANAQLLAVKKAFPDGKFTEITVGKLKFASVDAMADFIKEHNKKILDAVKAMKENPGNNVQTNALTLSLGGYDFVVKTEMSRETVNNGGLLFAEIHRRMSYSCPELGLNNVPVKQSLLRNAVEDITENVITGRDFAERFDIATRMVQHGKSELEQLKQREGKPFEFGKELEEAKRQFEEYSEAMKVEMAEKEKKYAEMDASVDAATDVVADDEDEAAEDKTKFRLLDADDPKAMELESLPESELVPVYCNVQAFEDDALGSPMAFTDAETGERRTLEGRRWNYSAPPKVELTEEQQRKLDELNKSGYIMVDGKKSTELQINDGLKFVKPKTKEAQLQYFLKKNPEDKGLWAAYDPYDHAIETPLNTQFGEAYKRPNLVVVRSLIPKSEIDEPFHADYALLPTGAHQWNNGRTLYLSRWSKIDKVLTREEEAKLIDEYWKKHPGKREELKTHRDYNRFVPQVRRELEKMGYRFELDGKELTPEESLALDKQNWESRDIIPGCEGHTPFVSNEDIARINAKMAGKWVGEPKEAMESAMSERVTELSERLHTPVRIIRTEEEVAALPSVRQRRMKGSFNPITGEVTIVVPNNANMADIENTFVHEVVGHDGLRVLFPEEQKLNNALDELYRVSKDEIRGTIDRMAQKMYDAEVDRIREKKRKEHVANGEDANASYYADMAAAHAEAGKKREQFKRDATEEYGADLAGRIGEKGFKKMSAEELTFWGKLKAMLQKALQKLLDGLKIPGKRKWGDKDWAFVLHEAYKRKKNGGKPTVFDAADTEVMRRKTGFGDTKFSDGKNKTSEPKPIGHSTFGSVYNQFKGKVLQAVKFLVNHESGDLLGVFHRNDVGDIDMVWGNEGGGLCHILNKHINDKDFPTVKDLVSRIEDIINKGEVDERHSNADKLVLVKDGYLVTIRRNVREKGIKIADKNWVLTAYNKDAPATTKAPVDGTYGSTAVAPGTSSDAKLATKSEINEFSDNNVADEGIMFRDGDMGLEETITKMKVEASQANADNWQAKQDAMRAIGGNLNKLRQAMARQREYDLSTVKSITDLAKVLLENGLLDDLSKYETKRILSAVNNVHGKQDVSDYVQKVMDIMVDNQLRMGANQLGKLLSIRGSRVDARGIEVQGQLDPEGQRIAQVVRKATSLPKENIEERIADCTNRMSSDDNAVAEEAAIEYSGLLLAHQFVEDITESKAEEKALRESIKEAKADLDAGTMEADAYREYVESTNDAIRQNKIERAEAYRSIVEQVGGVLGGSVERAKAWREAEKQRVETIHHNANSDMTGRPNDEHHKESKAQKIANNSIVRFVLAPLGTFDQMLRMFGKKSVNGEGYLWNRYMRGWVEATEKEYTGYQNALKTLDEKVSEVFDKKMKWGDLFSLERNLPKATVTFWDGGEQKAHELTQGNLLYIYMVDKMADGRMKLRRMGITEEDVENIKEFVDPRFLELADWMQDEFLVEKRNEYNEVHKRMFGASMAAIENYFPLKILANARIEEVDVADDTTDTALPATSTGSIIKRRRNNLALDVMGADAFSVILDHIQQMERWASFAEFNRDLNTLLSYKRFRNQVMNMTSVYGGGKTLWKNFRNVCSMAAGAYRPPIADLDKAAVNVAKGVTAAKVSFRVFTALKQFLSMPAYLSDSSPVYLAGNIANPIGAWKWSMENLPLFEKRWKSRMAGDPRLMKSEMDWKMWQNRAVEIASRIGMSPNAFVDALTVAIGAHSMYQTKKKKYLRYGYDEETAEKRAKQDATILFNQTQQSSESAFLSTMQTDRSWLSVLFTVFRNSSMSYTRQLYDALRNLKHRFEPGYKGLTEEYLAKQMRRDGIDPDKADQNAKSEYRRSLMRDIVRVGVFGYLLQFAWNLGAYLPYLLLGDDKDEKSDMWHDIFCHTMFGSIEGLTGGDVMSAVGNGFAKGEGLNLFSASKDMPLSSDLQNIVNKWNKDKVAAMNDVTNLMVQSGIGVNPQSLTDAVVAIMDYCGDDANTSRECALLIMRIINCPQSQIDKIYFDELNATAAEAQGMTPAEIAERYARYKMHRGAPLTGWAYTDEARDSVMTAQQNRVLTKAKEKLNSRMETEETKQLLSDYDAVAKQETALSKIKKTDRVAYREGMKQLRQSNDMRQHMRLKRYKHDMNELTSKYLRCKSAEERDSIVSTMFSTRAKMLEDIDRLKQQ